MTIDQGSAVLQFGTQATSLTGTLATIREQDSTPKNDMAEPKTIPKAKSETALPNETISGTVTRTWTNDSSSSSTADASAADGVKTPELSSPSPIPSPHLLSRDASLSDISAFQEEWEIPPESLTVFELLDNLALPAKLESWQTRLAKHTERVRRQQARIRSQTTHAKDRVVEEWRRRVQPPDEQQLHKYRKRMRQSVDRVLNKWNDAKSITLREKLSFIAAVFNIFISGYLIGAFPHYFYFWFTAQFFYFMPIRYYTYHKRGYHYFLADMCYFVNLLLLLTIWVAPRSKRLFIATYCLANGNNAVAIAMWRNSMVFHSLDKVTSLFIHIMPPVTLHCLVHLTPTAMQQSRFPGAYAVKHSSPDSPIHYSLLDMIFWSTVPYAIWQFTYHFFISIRRADKIAAGRPTSFTWLSKSYGKSWIGKLVLGLPKPLQEPGFMLTQYLFALGSMLPCPIWLWYRYPSATFLTCLFAWSIYNGATYYIDVFGKRFQKELEQMKKDIAKWQSDGMLSPMITPRPDGTSGTPLPLASEDGGILGVAADGMPERTSPQQQQQQQHTHQKSESSIDKIPLLETQNGVATGIDGGGGAALKPKDILKERKS